MAYNGGIGRHSAKVDTRFRGVFLGVTTEVGRSVRDGSEITGALGQPRHTSTLYFSWIDRFVSEWVWQLVTNCAYAKDVEDNPRGVTFRNHGPHSVKVTMSNADLVVRHVAAGVR